jgi:hypothetical protein
VVTSPAGEVATGAARVRTGEERRQAEEIGDIALRVAHIVGVCARIVNLERLHARLVDDHLLVALIRAGSTARLKLLVEATTVPIRA